MGKRLTKREFEYKIDLFETFGIKREDAVGKSLEQLSTLIDTKYKPLAFMYHTDRSGGNEEKITILNSNKNKLKKYIKNLEDYGRGGILATKIEELTVAPSGLPSRRKKAYLLYNGTISLITISRIILYFYLIAILAIKCKNSQLSLNNTLLIGALVCLIAIPTAYVILCFRWLSKKYKNAEKDLKAEHEKILRIQFSGKDLENELKKAFNSEEFQIKVSQELQGLISNSKNKISKNYSFIPKCITYLWALSITLTSASLIIESALSDFKTVDTKLLVGLSLLILSFGLQYLANEIYERKVVNLVKEERAEGELNNIDINVLGTAPAKSLPI